MQRLFVFNVLYNVCLYSTSCITSACIQRLHAMSVNLYDASRDVACNVSTAIVHAIVAIRAIHQLFGF